MGPIDSLGGRGAAARLAMAAVLWPLLLPAGAGAAGTYVHWVAENGGISRPLADKRGDPQRGLALVVDSHKGNCLTCHHLPIAGEAFQGDLGPSLHGVAARLTEAQIRLRVVDEKQVNPDTVMPGYYRDCCWLSSCPPRPPRPTGSAPATITCSRRPAPCRTTISATPAW